MTERQARTNIYKMILEEDWNTIEETLCLNLLTGIIIYVGKAKSLSSRIKYHYDESIFIANGDTLGIARDNKKGMSPALFNNKLKDDKPSYKATIASIEVDDEFKIKFSEDILQKERRDVKESSKLINTLKTIVNF